MNEALNFVRKSTRSVDFLEVSKHLPSSHFTPQEKGKLFIYIKKKLPEKIKERRETSLLFRVLSPDYFSIFITREKEGGKIHLDPFFITAVIADAQGLGDGKVLLELVRSLRLMYPHEFKPLPEGLTDEDLDKKMQSFYIELTQHLRQLFIDPIKRLGSIKVLLRSMSPPDVKKEIEKQIYNTKTPLSSIFKEATKEAIVDAVARLLEHYITKNCPALTDKDKLHTNVETYLIPEKIDSVLRDAFKAWLYFRWDISKEGNDPFSFRKHSDKIVERIVGYYKLDKLQALAQRYIATALAFLCNAGITVISRGPIKAYLAGAEKNSIGEEFLGYYLRRNSVLRQIKK